MQKGDEVRTPRPPLPPFSRETAIQKVRLAEDSWNSRDPEKVSLGYAVDSHWRNRAEFANGTEEIIAFLKEHLPEGLSGQLMQSLPDAHALASTFEENKAPESGGGLLGAITGLASKVFGDGGADASKALGMLKQSGLDLEQIKAFVPKALELIKQHIPAELYEKILALIPGFAPTAEKS